MEVSATHSSLTWEDKAHAALRGEDPLSALKGDVLRMLSISLGALWMKELKMEIDVFRSTMGKKGEVKKEDLRRAIEELKKEGLITYSRRIRATFGPAGGEEDILVVIANPLLTNFVLAKDREIREYVKIRESL